MEDVLGTLFALLILAFGFYLLARGVSDLRRRSSARELFALRALVDRIDSLAFDNRDINPELGTQVLDEIRAHRRREEARQLGTAIVDPHRATASAVRAAQQRNKRVT